MSDKIDISKLLPKISQLPVLPTAIAEILRVVNDPGSSGSDIEWAVSRDQAISAKVLKVVNAAAYGFSRRIETVRDASVMLGMRKMRDIAASMATADLFSSDSTGLVKGPRLWLHGLASSLWAREILTLRHLNGMDVVVTAALLHDVGIMVFHQYCQDAYHSVLEKSRETGRHHHRIEKKLLGITHAKLGAQLCAKWQLPNSLTQLINTHHSTFSINDAATAALVLADHLASKHGYGPFEWSENSGVNNLVLERLGMNESDIGALDEMQGAVNEQVAEFASVVFSKPGKGGGM